MNDNKLPGDEDQGGFNEDFDFGESKESFRFTSGGKKSGLNKNLLMGIFAVVVVGVGILGYKLYGSSKLAIAKIAKEIPAQIADKEPPTTTAKAATPTPTPKTKATGPSPATKPSAPTQEQNFGELAQAFSSADQNPAATPHAPVTPTAPATPASPATPAAPATPTAPSAAPPSSGTSKEGTIQELQKELFAPERITSDAQASAAAGGATASKTGTPTQPSAEGTTPGAPSGGAPLGIGKKAESAATEATGTAATAQPSQAVPSLSGVTPPHPPAAHGTPPSPHAAPAAPMSGSDVAQLTDSLHKLNQQIDYMSNKIKHLDSYTHEISENLTKLNETINALDTRVVALTNTTTTLSKDVGNVKSEVGHFREAMKDETATANAMDLSPPPSAVAMKKAAAMDGKITIEDPEYVLHAVIPGRAWLKNSKGQILTVTEGDTIGNYGKILVIDAANGVVLTSSGVTFR